MNNSIPIALDFSTPIQYISFGSVAVIANCMVIFILLRNKKFFQKSAFISGLALGDLLDGLALVVNGTMRILQGLNGTSSLLVHPSYCMITVVQPIFILGNQIPGVMFFLVGAERFLAICYFDWYYRKWSNKFAWMLTACAYIFSICSVAAAFIVAFSFDSTFKIAIACFTQSATGPVYSVYNYSVSIIGGMVAVVTTLTAMIVFTHRKAVVIRSSNVSTTIKSHVKKQWHITRMALCLAVVDFCLLVIPNILVALSSWYVNTSLGAAALRTWPLQLVSFRSILNVVIYLCINSEFQDAARLAFGSKRVSPIRLSIPVFNSRIKPSAHDENNF